MAKDALLVERVGAFASRNYDYTKELIIKTSLLVCILDKLLLKFDGIFQLHFVQFWRYQIVLTDRTDFA